MIKKVRQAVRFSDVEAFERLKSKENVIDIHEPYKMLVFSNPEDQVHNPSKVITVRDASKGTIETGLWLCYPKHGKRGEAIKWLEESGFTIAKKLPHCIAVMDVESLARIDEVLKATSLFTLVAKDEIGVAVNENYTDDLYEPGAYWTKAGVAECWAKLPEGYYGNAHAVEGSGMDITHPDLFGNVAGTYNGTNSTSNIIPVNPANEKHPYPVLGILCARTNNGLGVFSAGGNRIKGFMHQCGWNTTSSGSFHTSTLAMESCLAKALTDPNCLVVTMSFGSSTKFPGVQIAIDNLRTQGRGGKGIPVLASSGNSSLPNFTQYPAAYTGVIAVGACYTNGLKVSYSNYGPKLFCATYTGIHSIDARGPLGYRSSGSGDPNIEDYNVSFTGTSASSPWAAIQVAMLLAYKPDLTEAQVKQGIIESSEKAGGYNYVEGKSNELGYGVVQMLRLFNWADGYVAPAPKHNFTCVVSKPAQANIGDVITISVTGKTNTPNLEHVEIPVKVYWSLNGLLEASDPVIANLSIPLGNGTPEGTKSFQYTIPSGFGTRHVIAKIDPNNDYVESVESDNVYSSPITIPQPPAPAGSDMMVTGLYAYRAVKMIGGVMTDALFLNYRMKNIGTVDITSYAFSKGLTPDLRQASSTAVAVIKPGMFGSSSGVRISGDPTSPKVYCQIQQINGGVVNHEVIEVVVGPAPI